MKPRHDFRQARAAASGPGRLVRPHIRLRQPRTGRGGRASEAGAPGRAPAAASLRTCANRQPSRASSEEGVS
jgi:hypothetical protein